MSFDIAKYRLGVTIASSVFRISALEQYRHSRESKWLTGHYKISQHYKEKKIIAAFLIPCRSKCICFICNMHGLEAFCHWLLVSKKTLGKSHMCQSQAFVLTWPALQFLACLPGITAWCVWIRKPQQNNTVSRAAATGSVLCFPWFVNDLDMWIASSMFCWSEVWPEVKELAPGRTPCKGEEDFKARGCFPYTVLPPISWCPRCAPDSLWLKNRTGWN